MTSEILIISNDTVIMGADSAATINNMKTHTGANKLFGLSDEPPMAMMIFGAATFGPVRLETIIKEYRKQADFEELESVLKIKDSFIDYLNNIQYGITDFQDKLVLFKEDLFEKLRYGSNDDLKEFINSYENIEMLPFLENDQSLDIQFEDIKNRLGNIEVDINMLKKCFTVMLLDSSTGVVIAGFDKSNLLPSYISFNLITKYGDGIIISDEDSHIDYDGNLIIPFAQNDVVDAFMSGFDSEFEDFVEWYIDNYNAIFSKELIELLIEKGCIDADCVNDHLDSVEKLNMNNTYEFMEMVENFKEKNLDCIYKGIEAVSREVLISMVETMIRSTSLKRKFDSKLDSVGGDIDIIIITKADGLTYRRKIDPTIK